MSYAFPLPEGVPSMHQVAAIDLDRHTSLAVLHPARPAWLKVSAYTRKRNDPAVYVSLWDGSLLNCGADFPLWVADTGDVELEDPPLGIARAKVP